MIMICLSKAFAMVSTQVSSDGVRATCGFSDFSALATEISMPEILLRILDQVCFNDFSGVGHMVKQPKQP